MRPFLIDRNSAEMLSDLLAWNLKYKSVNANSGDPWCEKLLNELCDTFKFGGKLGAEREETFELWALRVQGRITHTSAAKASAAARRDELYEAYLGVLKHNATLVDILSPKSWIINCVKPGVYSLTWDGRELVVREGGGKTTALYAGFPGC